MKPTVNPLTLLNNPTLWKHLCNVNASMAHTIDQAKDLLPCSKKLIPHFNRARHLKEYRQGLEMYLLLFRCMISTAAYEHIYFIEEIVDEWARLEGKLRPHILELELLISSLPAEAEH